jgi:uncharacterized protein (DUF58 family)
MRRTETAPESRPQLRMTNTGLVWLVVSLGIGAVAWFKSINLVLLTVYTMLVLLVLNGLLAWLSVRRTSGARIATPPAFAGERVECGVRVTNGASRPVTVTVNDLIEGQNTSYLVYNIPAGATVVCTATRDFPRRGRFGGAVAVASGFPFGFLRCERPGDPGNEVVVLPRLGIATGDGLRRWLMRQMGSDDRSRRVQRRVTSDHADVRGLRPYRPGDPMRAVHWRTSARRGELMVREYDSAPSSELVMVVEPWLPDNPTAADRDRLEAALSLAVTVAITWRRLLDSPVTVIVPGAVPAVAHAASEETLRDALASLAEVTCGPMPDQQLVAGLSRHAARGARVVVSSRPNTPYAKVLAHVVGKPFVTISPSDRLPWYQPPETMQSAKGRMQNSA